MKKTLYDFCLEAGKARLLTEWDTARNLPDTPETISYGSRKRVHWICSQGHHWEALVQSRTVRDNHCPVCAGKQVLAGFNDLATRYPHLAEEWDWEKNGELAPEEMMPGSHQKVWWRCDQGHEWSAVIKSRASGAGCPFCANRKIQVGENDLESQFPQLAAQWDREKNAPLTPDMVLPGTRRKVWWLCDKGHSWHSSVSSRTSQDTDCPVCAGKQVVSGENDLAFLRPDLAEQWHPTKNLPLTPGSLTVNSNHTVWWQCSLGHEWRAPVGRRAQANTGCPVCVGKQVEPGFNDLATVDPIIAAQWAQDLNGSLTPEMVTGGSAKRVWWRCDQDHVWMAKIYARTGAQRTGCPICAGRHKKRYRNVLEISPETEYE